MNKLLLVILLSIGCLQALHAENLEEAYCENAHRRYSVIPGQYQIIFKSDARLKDLSPSDLKLLAQLQKIHLTKILQRYLGATKKIKLTKAGRDIEKLEQDLAEVKHKKVLGLISIYTSELEGLKEQETKRLISNTTDLAYDMEYNYKPLNDKDDSYNLSKEECLQEINFVRHLMQHPLIDSVEPNEFYRLESLTEPDDPLFGTSMIAWDENYPPLG